MRTPSAIARFLASALWAGGLILPFAVATDAQVRRPGTPRTGGIPGNELVIVATDYRFDAPEQVDAGLVNVRMFNAGKEHHHVLIIKLDRLDRVSQIAEYLKNNDWNVPWMQPLGGPESVGPGSIASASLVLEPGRYILACVVASPTTHRQHFMDGMIKELSVVAPLPGAPIPKTLPSAEITIKMFEWNFTIEGPIHAGRRTIRIDNIGKFEHHVALVRLHPGTTIEEAVKWAENPKGAEPYTPVGGTTGLGAGRSINVTVDLLPGDYALLCTLFNPLSKKTHSGHGMFKPLRVTL